MALKKALSGPNRRGAAWAAGGVVAALALAGGGWLLNRSADTPSDSAASAPSASLSPTPEQPQQPHAAAQPVSKTEQAAAPSSAASAAALAARPALPKPAPSAADELRKVQLALEGNASPADALAAAKTLAACKGADGAVESVYKMRDQGDAGWREAEKSAGFRTEELITEMQALQRRCQVFDAATLARRAELLKRAYDGGAKDAALDYLMWLNLESKQPVDPELLARLQRDARQTAEDGDMTALTILSYSFGPQFGITPMQRQAYKEAWLLTLAETAGPTMAKTSRDLMDNLEKGISQAGKGPPLSAEQQREANALTERVVGAWRKRQVKGG